jgi:hypothetical protein
VEPAASRAESAQRVQVLEHARSVDEAGEVAEHQDASPTRRLPATERPANTARLQKKGKKTTDDAVADDYTVSRVFTQKKVGSRCTHRALRLAGVRPPWISR